MADPRPVVAGRLAWIGTEAGPPLVVLAALLAAWQLATALLGVPSVVLPSPVEVAVAFAGLLPTLLSDAVVTAATAGLGLAAGVVVGLGFAFGMVASRSFESVAAPYVVALRIAPLVAIAPLLFLWVGRGIPARALLVATMTVFPVTIASVGGLRAVPSEYGDLAASVAAPPLRVFLRVRVPAAAPSVFAGVKLAAALAVIGAVVAEFVALDAGLGYRVFVTSTNLQTARTFAALAALAALGLVFYGAPAMVERRLGRTR